MDTGRMKLLVSIDLNDLKSHITKCDNSNQKLRNECPYKAIHRYLAVHIENCPVTALHKLAPFYAIAQLTRPKTRRPVGYHFQKEPNYEVWKKVNTSGKKIETWDESVAVKKYQIIEDEVSKLGKPKAKIPEGYHLESDPDYKVWKKVSTSGKKIGVWDDAVAVKNYQIIKDEDSKWDSEDYSWDDFGINENKKEQK